MFTLCSVEGKTSFQIPWRLMDGLQWSMKRPKRYSHDKVPHKDSIQSRINLNTWNSLEFSSVFLFFFLFFFFFHELWVLAYRLLFSTAQWDCWGCLFQAKNSNHRDCHHFTIQRSQIKPSGTLENHSYGLAFLTSYGIHKGLTSTSHTSTFGNQRDLFRGASWQALMLILS